MLVVGASIGSFVSLTRILAGMTVRTDVDPFVDARNLAINIAVVACAVYFGQRDIKQKDELLMKVARELGEVKPSSPTENEVGSTNVSGD